MTRQEPVFVSTLPHPDIISPASKLPLKKQPSSQGKKAIAGELMATSWGTAGPAQAFDPRGPCDQSYEGGPSENFIHLDNFIQR